MSGYPFTDRPISPQRIETVRDAMQSFVGSSAPVVFFDGSTMLGEDFGECLVDGVHATDMAFYRMANALHDQLRELLER